MNEKLIERKLREAVKAKGGKAYKFTSPGNSGVFDRIVLMPGKQIWFVETKTTGKKLTALQLLFKKHVEELGFETRVIDDQKTLNDFLNEI
jgi:hypothetical protein